MTTDIRWALVLVSSLVLWLPALRATLDGTMDFVDGALRYVLGFGMAWFGIGIFDQIISRYASTPKAARQGDVRRRKGEGTAESAADDLSTVHESVDASDAAGGAGAVEAEAEADASSPASLVLQQG
ncbi:MAG TPA: hypothetical protein VM618_09870 [Acidimicrobiia bacterium]|nr:hypothetical protein [Acidimicrobiia bacterium]